MGCLWWEGAFGVKRIHRSMGVGAGECRTLVRMCASASSAQDNMSGGRMNECLRRYKKSVGPGRHGWNHHDSVFLSVSCVLSPVQSILSVLTYLIF